MAKARHHSGKSEASLNHDLTDTTKKESEDEAPAQHPFHSTHYKQNRQTRDQAPFHPTQTPKGEYIDEKEAVPQQDSNSTALNPQKREESRSQGAPGADSTTPP